MSAHLQFHADFQNVVHNTVLNNFQAKSDDKRTVVLERLVWGPALVAGFRFLAEDRIRVAVCDHLSGDLVAAFGHVMENDLPEKLSDISSDDLAKLVASIIDEDMREKFETYIKGVARSADLVKALETSKDDTHAFKAEELTMLLTTVSFVLLFHPTFFVEEQRENLVALIADEAVIGAFGSWPE